MTISYTLQPVPDWYFADLVGKPLAGGKMYTYSSLDPSQSKPVFQDPAGVNEWPNPVIFDANGMQGPFYWKLDTTDPDDLYFIQIFDNNNNLVFQIDQYPISGGSGGGTVNTVQSITNLFVNSSFLYNIEQTTVQPIADGTFLAPGSHTGLFFEDITFVQEGVSNATDTLTFNQFAVGTNPLNPDFAPAYYINYTCSNSPIGETLKGIRIPLAPYVNTVANQTFTLTFYARSTGGGGNVLNIQGLQYFGTGGSPSSPVTFAIGAPITLTGSFAIYSVQFSVPTVVGKTLGDSNDDGTYIEILFPVSVQSNIDIAKPALFAGSLFPTTLYETVEQIEARLETPRTGDVRISSNAFSNNPKSGVQAGWIPLNDGTIGNLSSNATTRAKPDTWLLYKKLWEGTIAANCQIYDSTGVQVVKGGSAVADWNANRSIMLPRTQGRALLDRGDGVFTTRTYTADAATDILTLNSALTYKTGDPITISPPFNNPRPLNGGVTYYAIFVSTTQMKLAYSAEAAIAGTNVDFTSGGSGTLTTPPIYPLAFFEGEGQHQLDITEMPAHSHPPTPGTTYIVNNAGSGNTSGGGNLGSANSTSQGSSYPHNNMQPSVFYNMIIKL